MAKLSPPEKTPAQKYQNKTKWIFPLGLINGDLGDHRKEWDQLVYRRDEVRIF
jgi:hypothetical protein